MVHTPLRSWIVLSGGAAIVTVLPRVGSRAIRVWGAGGKGTLLEE